MAKKTIKKTTAAPAKKASAPVAKKTAAPAKEKRVFKTVRKVSGVRKAFRAWKDWEEGDVVIGTYMGQHEDNYDKSNPYIKVEDAQFADDSGEEFFEKNLVLNSTGMLDKAFEEIEEGQLVQVTYMGMQEIEKGKYAGKNSHVIEVALVTEDDGEEDSEDEEYEEEEDEEEEEDL